MKQKFFLDTNIIIYAFHKSLESKSKIAKNLLIQGVKSNKGVISFQVIQEFINASTKKFKQRFKTEDLIKFVGVHLNKMFEIYPDIELYKEAILISDLNKIGFYDSLIIVAAKKAKCKKLYSEDLNHGQIIDGVEVVNPFK